MSGFGEPILRPGIVAIAHYEEAMKRAVLAVKFASATRLADALGRALGHAVRTSGRRLSAVCFVPLHPSRLRTRGYDQAALLAAGAARELGIPMLPLLRRRVANTQQARLGLLARHGNAAGLFTLSRSAPRVLPRRLLLVDDVMTSGATLEACRATLLQSGCEHVLLGVAALARPGRAQSEKARPVPRPTSPPTSTWG